MVCSDLKKKTTSLVLTDLDFSFSKLISSGWIELLFVIEVRVICSCHLRNRTKEAATVTHNYVFDSHVPLTIADVRGFHVENKTNRKFKTKIN